MLKPLEQFICDHCGQVIESPKDGYVEWLTYNDEHGKYKAKEFRIVHHHGASPYKHTRAGCYKHENTLGRSDIDLKWYLDTKFQQILCLLDLDFIHDPDGNIGCQIENFKEFTQFARRITIPYYEEARQYFEQVKHDEEFCLDNKITLFKPETLKSIIEKYS